MEEYLDILDQDGHLTGVKKLRSLVHQDGDWHRTIHVWVLNEKKGILLQKRCPAKDLYPNMLDVSVGGHLSSGDTSIEGAIREVQEEIGLTITKDDLIFIKTIKDFGRNYQNCLNNQYEDIYILNKRVNIDEITYQKEEISEINFVSLAKFKEMVNNNDQNLIMREEEFALMIAYIENL